MTEKQDSSQGSEKKRGQARCVGDRLCPRVRPGVRPCRAAALEPADARDLRAQDHRVSSSHRAAAPVPAALRSRGPAPRSRRIPYREIRVPQPLRAGRAGQRSTWSQQ